MYGFGWEGENGNILLRPYHRPTAKAIFSLSPNPTVVGATARLPLNEKLCAY